MHRRGKKKKTKPRFVTGVKEMDDGPIRTRHVPKNPQNIASAREAEMNVQVNT